MLIHGWQAMKMSYDPSSTQNGKSLLADWQTQKNSLGKQDVLG